MSHLEQDTPASPVALDPPQQSSCADADLMRHADSTRATYYDKLHNTIALASGQSPFIEPTECDGKRVQVVES